MPSDWFTTYVLFQVRRSLRLLYEQVATPLHQNPKQTSKPHFHAARGVFTFDTPESGEAVLRSDHSKDSGLQATVPLKSCSTQIL